MTDTASFRRVVVLVDQYIDPYGGTEGQIRALLEGLPPTWRAEMWVLQPSRWLKRHEFPCPTRNLGLRALARPTALVRMASLALELRRRGFDLVQTYMNDASVVGPLIARMANIPCVIARRDLGFWQTPRLLHVLRRTDRLAGGVIANCEAVREHTVATEHMPPAFVHVVANGHDPARFEVEAEAGLRARLGVPESATLVGLLANIKPLKRHDDLLDALARLKGDHPDVHALLIGEQVEPGPSLASRARGRGLTDRVHEVLATGNAIPLLKHLDIGVLCSETEGLSNAVIEYMGCGLPVVATRVGGNPDLVAEGENGYLYAAGDVDALTARLGELIADSALRRRLGDASRQRFHGRFTQARMVEETTALWDDAVVHRPGLRRSEKLSWVVVDTREGLERLAEPWDALLRRDQLFLGPDWMLAWLEGGEPGAKPYVIAGYGPNDRLVGLLPLVERPGSVLAFPGQGEGADHLDVVAAAGWEDEVAQGALATALLESDRRLRLLHIAEDGALRRTLHAAGLRTSPTFGEMRSTSCPYTAVDGRRWDQFVQQQFSYAARRNVRRGPRRFRKLDGAGVEQVTTPAEAPGAVDRFLSLHKRRFERKGEASSMSGDSIRAFHRALAVRMARRGRLAMTFLKLGTRDVACEYGFQHRDKFYAFQSGFVEASGVESPGILVKSIVMEKDVFGEGLVEYDFLDGTEEYKRRWMTGERRLYDVELRPPATIAGLRGLLKGGLRLTYDILFRSPVSDTEHPDPARRRRRGSGSNTKSPTRKR